MGLCQIVVLLAVASGLGLANSAKHASNSTVSDPEAREGLQVSIVGGNEITPYSWPFLVQLSRGKNKKIQSIWCGGAAINEKYILTAAHCLKSNKRWLKKLRVTASEHDITQTEGVEERYKVVKAILHPEYNKRTYENDIALLKLKTPLDLSSSRVELIDLNADASCPANDQACQVAGWGSLKSGGRYPDTPNEVTVSAVSNDVCNSRSAYNGKVYDSNVCAGEEQGGKDSCQGDSGGPFVCTCNGNLVHVGVVSWGEGCAKAGKPGVYTRTSSFVPWIENCIANNGNDCPPVSSIDDVTTPLSTE